jgi:hypothetical protein
MENNVNAPENLRVKVSKFKSDLSFNEWVKLLNVSSGYVQPTPYFTGNPKSEYVGNTEKREPFSFRLREFSVWLVNSIKMPF